MAARISQIRINHNTHLSPYRKCQYCLKIPAHFQHLYFRVILLCQISNYLRVFGGYVADACNFMMTRPFQNELQ